MSKKYHVVTFGCQMNENDSEKLAGILSARGYEYIETPEFADVLVINTCSVRENADDRFFGHLGTFKAAKKRNPDMIIAVCGCMMQQSANVEAIRASYPYVDIVFGTHNIAAFGSLLDEALSGKKRVIEVLPDGAIAENVPMERAFTHKAFVTIMNGCDNFCSYCIVPYTRGREKSREAKYILEEIRELAKSGCREVMLLGQNVNSYGKRGEIRSCSFAELLDSVAKIDGIKRIRFMSSHPKDFTDDVIAAIKNNDTVMNSIHLPMQSGSSRVLKLMNRRYDKENYLALVNKIRSEIPDIAITTDIIVGFPTETEEDFEETLDVVRRARFDSAFTFVYSPREGTKAAQMEGVDKEVVKARFDRLLSELYAIMYEKALEFDGKTVEVLVDGKSKEPGVLCGKTRGGKLVNFTGSAETGELIQVKITQPTTFYLLGERIG